MTGFFQRVWRACARIPPGRVSTYADLAKAAGNPYAARAVGTAVKNNPRAPRVPCHRVVSSDGRAGNYSGAGGARAKIRLLEKEGVRVKNGKIADFERVRYRFARAVRT